MALKALMLRKKIDDKKKALNDLRAKETEFQTREAELETAITEASTEEEQAAVEEEVEKFETEKKENEDAVQDLEKEIADLEADLAAEEAAAPLPAPQAEREVERMPQIRTQFYGMTHEERDAFFKDEKLVKFLGEVRTCIKEKRAIANVGLTIPEVMLPLLTQRIQETSKLMKYVTVERVSGTARQVIMGSIPEAVWTEMCATLNELNLGFNDIEVDGYKVGGYFAVCNAIIEDNDVSLVTKITEALAKAISKALDKAIVYGTGVKMPVGIVTRLAQTVKPSGYLATTRPWADLHTSNIITGTGKTGIALFKEMVANTGVIINDYFEDSMVWLMNRKTKTTLMVESMDKNANAAIVAGVNSQMPVIGGDIVELDFIPDGEIVFGYMEAYLLAERAGTKLESSEHAMFIEDRTVFKGTARYDGQPVIPEAFGVMSITTSAPTTTATFPTDSAN